MAHHLKVFVPERLNPFNNMDHQYAEAWTRSDVSNKYQKDMVSMAMIWYYIQTCGHHPYQLENDNRANFFIIRDNIRQVPDNFYVSEIENINCICGIVAADCKVISCRYRHWINTLASHVIQLILELTRTPRQLENYDQNSSTEWMKHPFFWESGKIINFIRLASGYVDGIDDTHDLKLKLGGEIENVASIMNDFEKAFPEVMKHCSSFGQQSKNRNNTRTRQLRSRMDVLKWIRDKVTIFSIK